MVARQQPQTLLCWPLDHYYSPVPDNRALAAQPARSRIWPATPRETPGIDWRVEEQTALLRAFSEQSDFPIALAPTGDSRDYHCANDMFSALDAWMLQAMLRVLRPARVIEVGCGWSSLVTARVNREYLDGAAHFTCIEPFPPAFLDGGLEGITELLETRVEQVSIERFLTLDAGDVLFIDTSHTLKTGGDVDFLLNEVLPRLAAGVVVHIHDIFLPWDYPAEWVMSGRAWNEQYAVRAFLTFNSEYEILIGVAWLSCYCPEVLKAAFPALPRPDPDGPGPQSAGGSLWIRRKAG